MDLFTDVTQFRFFSSRQKNKPHRSNYHAEFRKYAKHQKNPLELEI